MDRLFHGTNVESLAGILLGGVVLGSPPDDYDDTGVVGVSLTDCYHTAKKFADEDRDWDGRWNSPVRDGVIITFDAKRIMSDYPVVSVCWDGSSQEREYRVRGDITNVEKYILDLEVDEVSLEWWRETFIEGGEFELAAAISDVKALREIPTPGRGL